jgi:hypothetical protein
MLFGEGIEPTQRGRCLFRGRGWWAESALVPEPVFVRSLYGTHGTDVLQKPTGMLNGQ